MISFAMILLLEALKIVNPLPKIRSTWVIRGVNNLFNKPINEKESQKIIFKEG